MAKHLLKGCFCGHDGTRTRDLCRVMDLALGNQTYSHGSLDIDAWRSLMTEVRSSIPPGQTTA